MADMKEKLVKLMQECKCDEAYRNPGYCDGFRKETGKCAEITEIPCALRQLADHLIANDVTIPVRCKDCLGWCSEKIAKEYDVPRYCTLTRIPTDPDDFCSFGERRE